MEEIKHLRLVRVIPYTVKDIKKKKTDTNFNGYGIKLKIINAE